jgi:(1->4)-alpha-D-glucan 1-alpha-D-glucosylmutase
LYVAVEKILAMDEPMPADWAVSGTTGYDSLALTNALFVDPAGEKPLTDFFEKIVGSDRSFEELVYKKKRLILDVELASELRMLATQLAELAQQDRRSIDFTVHALHTALREVIACFPVYRSYVRPGHISEQDTRHIEQAIDAAIARSAPQYSGVFDYLRDILLLRYPRNATDEIRAAQNAFVLKFQQLTSPTTAKGIEDTSFYIYNRLTSLNEVGGNPGKFSVSPDELHRYFEHRQKNWPLGLSPLTTHDTKRSEDVRARISVLSEIPADWRSAVEGWFDLNKPIRRQLKAGIAPAPNDEYLLYQTLIGAWPFGDPSQDEYADFTKRISAYMLKAMREAKVRTNWTHPDTEYEKAVDDFVHALLDRRRSEKFFATFSPLATRISDIGIVNSLLQTLIRLTAPGVPDTYQGSELWDLSLVDPDNRRPVDYARRRSALADLKARWDSADRVELLRELWSTRQDARIKLLLIWRLHEARRARPDLFTAGEYVPLRPIGPAADRVFCFLRRHGSDALLVIATRHTAALGPFPWATDPLAKTSLPDLPTVPFRDLFTGLPYDPAAALRNLPVAVFGSWE